MCYIRVNKAVIKKEAVMFSFEHSAFFISISFFFLHHA